MAPDPVGPPGGKRRVQVGPTEIAKASVMRLEYSPEKSSCLTGGSSPLLVIEMVGTASSSLTPGSSIESVAGKNRLPAISWAVAPARGNAASVIPETSESDRMCLLRGGATQKNRIDISLLRENRGRD